VLLVAWPTFPGFRSGRRSLLNHLVSAVVLAVATVAAMYYFYPWRFARFSPLAAAVTAAALLYLWLRATWAYLPLHRLYRWGPDALPAAGRARADLFRAAGRAALASRPHVLRHGRGAIR